MAKAKSFRRLCNACVRLDANAAMPVLLALAVAGSGDSWAQHEAKPRNGHAAVTQSS